MPVLNMVARRDGVEPGWSGTDEAGELMSVLNGGGMGEEVEEKARSAILWCGIALCLLLSKIASVGFPCVLLCAEGSLTDAFFSG